MRASATTWRTSSSRATRTLIVVAPASADFLAKLAHGLADDLLSTLCLARECPLAVAPAMNRQMWENAATQRNVEQLRDDGVAILGPGERRSGVRRNRHGPHARSDARSPRRSRHCSRPSRSPACACWSPRARRSKRSTRCAASPTAARARWAIAVARAAREAGAEVTLVSGPTALAAPAGVERVDVVSARRDVRRGQAARRRCRHLHQRRGSRRLPAGAA